MRALLTLALCIIPLAAGAETATIAVASNFAVTAEELAADFARASGHEVAISAAATGKLYAQITHGAPFDALLSADQAVPARLAEEGLADPATQMTYALGGLALWSADPDRDLSDPKAALRAATHVAIANPDVAPYGQAAREALAGLDLTEQIAPKLVTAENIGQAQSMVASGAADLGFVATSGLRGDTGGAAWIVPADMHAPLLQDAILLRRGADNAAARGFLAYLATPGARARIAAAGYTLP